MLFYHGTAAMFAREIEREGLKPRRMIGGLRNGESNWTNYSNPNAVYLAGSRAA